MQHDQRKLGHVAAGGRNHRGGVPPDFIYQRNDDRIIIKAGFGERTEHCGNLTSYTYQLQAFINAVRDGAPYRTDADDAVATMSLIGNCYRIIGLEPRPAHR